MGRAEKRKQRRYFKSKMTDEQLKKLEIAASSEYIKQEVERKVEYNMDLFKEALSEAFKRNNISSSKANAVMDDMVMIMKRKAEERKKNG